MLATEAGAELRVHLASTHWHLAFFQITAGLLSFEKHPSTSSSKQGHMHGSKEVIWQGQYLCAALDYEFMMTPFWTCIVQKILFHEFLSQLFRDDFPQS